MVPVPPSAVVKSTQDALAPIVVLAAALIAGAASGGARPSPAVAGSAAAACAALIVAMRHRPLARALTAAGAACAFGAWLSASAWREGTKRLEATFGPQDSLELSIDATVLAAPERDRQGARQIAVLTIGTAHRPVSRLRLEVADVPADDAARLDALRRGDTVRCWCRLRAPAAGPGSSVNDARRRLAAARLDATARVKSSRLVARTARGAWSPGRAVDVARVGARSALDAAVGTTGEARAVLGAMLLGDRLLLDDQTNLLLRDAGLIHILSISGLHTALTIVLLLGLLRRTGLGPGGRLVWGALSLVAFSCFVGHGASVWRACASLAITLVARALSRDVDALSGLALASGALVIAVPALAWNAGFLLSVAATAGLLAACPPARPGRLRPSILKRSLAASSGAYLATAPMCAWFFARLAPVALAANLAAAPLCAACLAAGAAAIALTNVPFVGSASATAAKLSVAALLAVSRCAGAIPGGHVRVAAPGPWLIAVYVALLFATWRWDDARRGRVGRLFRLAFVLCAIALHLGPIPPGPGPASVTVIDVGQGLSVLLGGEDGRFVLADAGPTSGGRFDAGDRIVVPYLAARGCRRLEVLALSHDHDDHAGGALAVLRDLDVGELWVGEGSVADPLTRRVAAEAVARGVAVRRMRRGDRVLRAAFDLSVLHPGLADADRTLNDRCLVLRASCQSGASVVLPGDLEAGGENALLNSRGGLRSAALVAPHHGADGSSTTPFLDAVAPEIVLVSAGARNRFGHPGRAALARYAAASARVFRTDRDGTLTLTSSGRAWTVSVENERHGDEGEDEDDDQGDGEGATRGP